MSVEQTYSSSRYGSLKCSKCERDGLWALYEGDTCRHCFPGYEIDYSILEDYSEVYRMRRVVFDYLKEQACSEQELAAEIGCSEKVEFQLWLHARCDSWSITQAVESWLELRSGNAGGASNE